MFAIANSNGRVGGGAKYIPLHRQPRWNPLSPSPFIDCN